MCSPPILTATPPLLSLSLPLSYPLQPVTGELADELVEACPGLFVLTGKGSNRSAEVTDPIKHEMLLEKVESMNPGDCRSEYFPMPHGTRDSFAKGST